MKMYRAIVVVIFFLASISMLPGQLDFVSFTDDRPEDPVDLTNANDGSGRIFVVEKGGTIWIYDQDGNRTTAPFLDISGRVRNAGERGLLGLAFHPNFANNGFFFVNYVNRIGSDGQTIVARYTASGNAASASSEVILLTIDQPYNNHNGGQIHFGPQDGYLYISTGDGGSGGDPGNRAQSLTSMHGKLLRIDVSTAANPTAPGYSIPSDNPFASSAGLDEIWSFGLRNPWRFSFDEVSGDLWIGDVGQSTREEINHTQNLPGINFGWKCREGFLPYNGCTGSGFTDPVWEYETGTDGNSVTGGVILASDQYSEAYRGHYIFGDYANGRLWTIAPDGNRARMAATRLDETVNQLSAFGRDEEGNVYALSLGGDIFRISDPNLALPVDMISAVVKRQDEKVQLEWTTGLEYNASHFVIEVRGEGGVFEEVGRVPSKGDSNEPTDYLFTDLVGAPGLYFYRLKSVDLDGSSSFSMILEIRIDAEDDLVISPNPARDRISIYVPSIDEIAELQIVDLQGRVLVTQQVQPGTPVIDFSVSGFASGAHIVKFRSEYLSFTEKVLVH